MLLQIKGGRKFCFAKEKGFLRGIKMYCAVKCGEAIPGSVFGGGLFS